MRVALINTNRMRPPIAPIGLEYVAEALAASGHEPEVLDLAWEPDPQAAISKFFRGSRYPLTGISLRNTDDCGFLTRESFLPGFATVVKSVRASTESMVVLGGAGFSTMPREILSRTDADAGVWGDGEFAFAELAGRLERNEDWRGAPNLVWREGAGFHRTAPSPRPLAELPAMSRAWVDNRRYFREGGQAGLETKRGCPGECTYCADPAAKGRRARLRPPRAVANELERLLDQGIDHIHTCDSEFNLPASHAFEICREIVRRGLGRRARWYAYCSPAPFSRELARAMRAAGFAGINFGADSGDAGMLRRLGRAHGPDDIVNATRWSREEGLSVMLDLLLGSPGETRDSLARTVELVRRAEPDRAGVSVGVRVYPGTELSRRLTPADAGASLIQGDDELAPVFYLEPAVQPFIFELLDSLIGGDPRFLFFDPSKPDRNYNYNANLRLEEAIGGGARGAYWDILRRLAAR